MNAKLYATPDHAKIYAIYRPKAPPHLIKIITEYVRKMVGDSLDMAVDAGCGSGQSTFRLAETFKSVIGVDISEAQIKEANDLNTLENVKYMVSPAENLPLKDNSVQLITTGQACHWFDMPSFFTECDRILSPGGVIALYTYIYPRPIFGDVSEDLFKVVTNMYDVDLGPYWPKEIDMIRNGYTTIDHPFPDGHRIEDISMERTITVAEFMGFFRTLCSFQRYKKDKGDDAAETLMTTFTSKFMKLLEVSTTPQETEIVIKHPYVVLLGSKPK